jgi:hypothetical protein
MANAISSNSIARGGNVTLDAIRVLDHPIAGGAQALSFAEGECSSVQRGLKGRPRVFLAPCSSTLGGSIR